MLPQIHMAPRRQPQTGILVVDQQKMIAVNHHEIREQMLRRRIGGGDAEELGAGGDPGERFPYVSRASAPSNAVNPSKSAAIA